MKAFLVLGACLALISCGGSESANPTTSSEPLVEATAAAHENDTPAPTPIAEGSPSAPVIGQELAYGSTSTDNLIGYLALPEDVIEPLSGIIVIHEWWGLNDNIKAMTRKLAGEGYVVLAVDLYHGAIADTPAEAEELMTEVMSEPEAAIANLREAHAYLNQYALAPRIATLGWCLGGGWSLRAGIELADEVDAVVMYYGAVVIDESELDRLHAPLLGFFAELDEAIPLRDVQRFRTALRDLGKSADVLVYPGVEHAFANPSGGEYDESSADDAWAKTVAFLEANLTMPEETLEAAQ